MVALTGGHALHWTTTLWWMMRLRRDPGFAAFTPGYSQGTVLRFDQHVTNVDDAVEGCWMVGMYTSLARLEPVLAGAPVPWDWDLFAAARAHYAALGLSSPDPEAAR